MITSILKAIIALPQIFGLVMQIFKMIAAQKAKKTYESEIKKNEEVVKGVENAQTYEEFQKSLNEAAKKWNRKS